MAIKTNERPGTRAVLRHCNMSSYKVREVLDLVRGMDYQRATEVLEYTDRAAAPVVLKLLKSAAANAEHNEGLDSSEMYVATAFADEGTTLKRWRPRARGRATRIRKRSSHITLILARMPEDQIARRRARVAANAAELRARRVAGTRRRRTPATAGTTSTAPAEQIAFVDEALEEDDLSATEVVDTAFVEDEGIETEATDVAAETEADAAESKEATDTGADASAVADDTTPDEVVVDGTEEETPEVETDAAASKEEGN